MNHNLLFSDRVAVVGVIDPAAIEPGAVSTGWIDMAEFFSLMGVISTGVLGTSATVDAKIEQAQDASGTGVKDVTGRAITQIVKASGDNKQALLNFRQADLDFENEFTHARLTLTVGTAASTASATLLATDARYGTASSNDAASVIEIV